MELRTVILKAAYSAFPFSLRGDAELEETGPELEVSCVINFYKRTDLLRNILSSLAAQTLDKKSFEVILVEDRGGTDEGRREAEHFGRKISVRYFTLEENHGVMGHSRNYGLGKCRGRIVLFLDDDTVILDRDFLKLLIEEFDSVKTDGIMPYGSASYCMLEDRYGYHDPYFPANKCTAYSMEALRELGGFVSDIIGQEDVEFFMRFNIAGKKIHRSNSIGYMHTPLLYDNLNKAAAVGASYARLRSRYPLPIWLMILANGARDLPKLVVPGNRRYRMQGMFSLGFVRGIWYSLTGKRTEYN